MSLFYRPSVSAAGGGDGPGSPFNGTSEVTYGGMSAYAESQLSTPQDVTAAHGYFTGTGAEAHLPAVTAGGGHEVIAAKLMGAVPGAETALGAIAQHAAAEAAISPVIQLIMRLPGALGVGQSFFEFLGALFMPGANLIDAFNPLAWAEQLKAGLASALSTSPTQHFAMPMSLLPHNAPIFQHLGHASLNGLNGTGFRAFEAATPQPSLASTISFKGDHLNISGPLDLKKVQFEGAPSSASSLQSSFHHEGVLSGPSLNSNLMAQHLAGAKRMFADKVAAPSLSSPAAGNSQTLVSSTQVPAGGAQNSALNIGASTFSQEHVPVSQLGDGALSGTSLSSGNVGYHLAGSGSSFDSSQALSPSGAVSERLGGNSILAERPLAGGYYNQPAVMDQAAQSAASSSGELKALSAGEALSIKKVVPQAHAKPVMDHQGHQTKGLHHSSSTHTTGKAVDQVSHTSTPSHHATKVHHAAKSPVAEAPRQTQPVQQVEQAQPAATETQAPTDATQTAQATDATATDYTVERGDCLWNIAKDRLGDGTKWTQIYQLNQDVVGANPGMIHVGTHLRLPGADGAVAQTASAGHHVVQPGDNLWDIARRDLGDGSRWGEIYKANANIIGDNPRMIMPGQDLQMPGAEGAATSISQAAPAAVDPVAVAPTTAAPAPVAPVQAPVASQVSMQPQAQPLQSYYQPQAAPVPQNDYQGMLSQNQGYPLGPGAAGAATLDGPQNPVVNSSLGSDLASFLGSSKK